MGGPGRGVEPGETSLAVGADPPHVWHQRVVAAGYDGVINDYFLVRTAPFRPRGTMSRAELAGENIDGFRWWPPQIAGYRGTDLFSPRPLGTPLPALLAGGVPPAPAVLGL